MDIRIGNDIRLNFYFNSDEVNITKDNIISAECKIIRTADYEMLMSLSNCCIPSKYEFHSCGKPGYNVFPHLFHRSCGIFVFDDIFEHNNRFFDNLVFLHHNGFITNEYSTSVENNHTVITTMFPGKCQKNLGAHKVIIRIKTSENNWGECGIHTYTFDYDNIDFRLVAHGGISGSITLRFDMKPVTREVESFTEWTVDSSFSKPEEFVDYTNKDITLSGAVVRNVVYKYSDGRPNVTETETKGLYWKMSTDNINYYQTGVHAIIPEYDEGTDDTRTFYFKGYINDNNEEVNIPSANFTITQSVKPYISLGLREITVDNGEVKSLIPIITHGNVNLNDVRVISSVGFITILKEEDGYYFKISSNLGEYRSGVVSINYDGTTLSFKINQDATGIQHEDRWNAPVISVFEYEPIRHNITVAYPTTIVITQQKVRHYDDGREDIVLDTITYENNASQFDLHFGGTYTHSNNGSVTFPSPNTGTENHTVTSTLYVVANGKQSEVKTAIVVQKFNPVNAKPFGYYGFMNTQDILDNGITENDATIPFYSGNYEIVIDEQTLLANRNKRLVVITSDIFKPQAKITTTLGDATDVLDVLDNIVIDNVTYTPCYHPNLIGSNWTSMTITPSNEVV